MALHTYRSGFATQCVRRESDQITAHTCCSAVCKEAIKDKVLPSHCAEFRFFVLRTQLHRMVFRCHPEVGHEKYPHILRPDEQLPRTMSESGSDPHSNTRHGHLGGQARVSTRTRAGGCGGRPM